MESARVQFHRVDGNATCCLKRRGQREVVFLLDVDNTLLDADRVTVDLGRYLEKEAGHDRQQRYWNLFKQLRDELGYADYLGALQRYRIEYSHDPHVLMLSRFLLNYPFSNCLFPNALTVVNHVNSADRSYWFRMGMRSFSRTRSSAQVSLMPWTVRC